MISLDEKDWVLIGALKKNARRSIVDLARIIKLSRTATHDRLIRLEENQVIRNYTIVVDSAQIPNARAFFAIQLNSATYNSNVLASIEQYEEVTATYHLAGDVDLMLQVESRTNRDLHYLREHLARVEGIKTIRTYFILLGELTA